MHRHVAISILSCLLVLCAVGPVVAEVAAKTDKYGQYVSTQVTEFGSSDPPLIWTVRVQSDSRVVLNPDGDLYGDLAPTVAESPTPPFHPSVVWSRFNGADYDLVWSSWSDNGWTPVSWVQSTAGPGDDLDPRIGFDSTGLPYLVWWSEEQGQGRVFLTVRLVDHWMTPVQVSESEIDARYPDVAVDDDDGSAEVTYTTPQGPRRRKVWINRPVTITDDIDPQVTITDGQLPDEM